MKDPYDVLRPLHEEWLKKPNSFDMHQHLTLDSVNKLLDVHFEVWIRMILHLMSVCPVCYRGGGGYILDAYEAGFFKPPFGPEEVARARAFAQGRDRSH